VNQYPLAKNVAFVEDGVPVKILARENFLVVDDTGTLNVMYRDQDDTTRLILTFAMGDDYGERMIMMADRTPGGIPDYVPDLVKETFMPGRAMIMAGMQFGDILRGAIMVSLPGAHYKPDQGPQDHRN